MKNSINWFEIPAKNFDRAKEFYGKLFGSEIQVMPHPEMKYGILPGDMQNGGVTEALWKGRALSHLTRGRLFILMVAKI